MHSFMLLHSSTTPLDTVHSDHLEVLEIRLDKLHISLIEDHKFHYLDMKDILAYQNQNI